MFFRKNPMYKIVFFAFGLICLLVGCSGYSALPKINFIGKTRAEAIGIFASAPRVLNNEINIGIPLGKYDNYSASNNLYFKTADEALLDKRVMKAPYIRGYQTVRRLAIPGGWDYYLIIFDASGKVAEQRVVSIFDGP